MLKGPVLAYSVYKKPFHRTFSDIDLLIPPDELDELVAHGGWHVARVFRDDSPIYAVSLEKG